MYPLRDGRSKELIGSSVLLEIYGSCFVLTCAHVVDQFRDRTMKLDPTRQLEFITSTMPSSGNRHDDPRDYAFAMLNSNTINSITKDGYSFLPFTSVERHPIATYPHYILVGYPETQNRSWGKPYRQHTYYESSLHPDEMQKYQGEIDGNKHIAIPFSKHAYSSPFDGEKLEVLMADLHGRSGGGVWGISSNDLTTFSKLVGIFMQTTKDGKVLVATRVGLFIAKIDLEYPHVFMRQPFPNG